MYTKLPYFVFGFHGCDQRIKDAVLKEGIVLRESTNPYDWLGNGIYFWEQNPQRALEFACLAMQNPKMTKETIITPAVIGAVIDLGNCLNLMDSQSILKIEMAYSKLEEASVISGEELPQNKQGPDRTLRYLDRSVIETLHKTIDNSTGVEPYDTVRALFAEGDDVYPQSGFKKQTHIQICVRNVNCIKGFFDPREKSVNPYISSAMV